MMNEKVASIMIKDLITLAPDSSLAEVHQIFTTHKIHHIPVTEDGMLVGLITTSDLWKSNIPHEKYGNVQVSEVMSKKLVKIEPDDKVGTAAELFLDNRFHALPVVSEGRLVGLVTTFDVLKYEFKKEYKEAILFKDVLEDKDKS